MPFPWLAVILGLLPSAAWLLFFLHEDRQHPEPKRLVFYVFILGMFVTFFVLQAQILANRYLTNWSVVQWSPLSILVLAGIEELGKFLVVYAAIGRNREFNEAIDPMVYMIIAALGFASVENIASALKVPNNFELMTLRFVGATLLHSLSSALVGYWWSLSRYRQRRGWLYLGTGLVLAIIVHGIFNYLIIKYGPGIVVSLLLIFVAFFILNDFEKLKVLPLPLPR